MYVRREAFSQLLIFPHAAYNKLAADRISHIYVCAYTRHNVIYLISCLSVFSFISIFQKVITRGVPGCAIIRNCLKLKSISKYIYIYALSYLRMCHDHVILT